MPQVIAAVMADGQVFLMTIAAFTERLNVLKRGIGMRHMLPANPTRHHAMQLARYRFVNFVAGELEPTQGLLDPSSQGFGVGVKVFDGTLGHTRGFSRTCHRRRDALDQA